MVRAEPAIHNQDDFGEPIKIHTAKCDRCNLNNKNLLYRCRLCAFQICTPCRENDVDDGAHLMNGSKLDFRWRRTAPSPPPEALTSSTLPAHSRATATSRARKTERPHGLLTPRKRKHKNVIDLSDDSADDDDDIEAGRYGSGIRSRRKRNKMATTQSSEQAQPTRTTRAAAKATLDITETANYLLALGSSPRTLSPTEGNSPDARGLLLLASAALWTEVSDAGVDEEQDAQAHSPLFCKDESDLVTLRGSELLFGGEDERSSIDPPQVVRRTNDSTRDARPKECKDVEELGHRTIYTFPQEIEVLTEINRENPGRQRLRDLYQSSLLYRTMSGELRRLSR